MGKLVRVINELFSLPCETRLWTFARLFLLHEAASAKNCSCLFTDGFSKTNTSNLIFPERNSLFTLRNYGVRFLQHISFRGNDDSTKLNFWQSKGGAARRSCPWPLILLPSAKEKRRPLSAMESNIDAIFFCLSLFFWLYGKSSWNF